MAGNRQKQRNIRQEETELDKKKKEMIELAKLIALNQGVFLNREKTEALRDWEARLEFRRNKLKEEYAIKEVEMRIEVFKNMLNVLKGKNVLE